MFVRKIPGVNTSCEKKRLRVKGPVKNVEKENFNPIPTTRIGTKICCSRFCCAPAPSPRNVTWRRRRKRAGTTTNVRRTVTPWWSTRGAPWRPGARPPTRPLFAWRPSTPPIWRASGATCRASATGAWTSTTRRRCSRDFSVMSQQSHQTRQTHCPNNPTMSPNSPTISNILLDPTRPNCLTRPTSPAVLSDLPYPTLTVQPHRQ